MIYVITHKIFDDELLNDDEYAVLHVGLNDNCKPTYIRDDLGDNISGKNPYYCELTGLYWIWKNSTESGKEPVGLVHYRRFFTYPIEEFLYTYTGRMPRILKNLDVKKTLKTYDAIMPTPERIFRTVEEFYKDHHNPNDLVTVRNVIEKLYPDYLKTYDEVLHEHYFYFANMIITKKEILDQYCEWLFNIMTEVEKIIIGSEIKDSYQSRIYGFISERLIQVWIEHNALRVKTYPVFNTEKRRTTIFQKNLNRVKHMIKRCL